MTNDDNAKNRHTSLRERMFDLFPQRATGLAAVYNADQRGLLELLVKKKLVTEAEYWDALADSMERHLDLMLSCLPPRKPKRVK